MNPRFAIFAFAVSACFAFVGHANMYNDWAQQSAVNLNRQSASTDAATMIRDSSAGAESEASQQCIARPTAYDLLKGINDANCNNANLRDAIVNADVPPTLKEMEDFWLGEFKELPLSESLYHNLREDITILPSVKDLMKEFNEWVQRDALGTLLNAPGAFQREEYYVYLDHEMPNRKFVSNDNHREAVYNRKTGELVKIGINAGTSNEASRNVSLRHLKDMARYYRCLTPNAEQKALGEELSRHPELVEWLAKNPDLIDDVLNGDISEPKCVVSSLEDKISRIQQKAKDTLLGNHAKDVIEPDQLRDEAKSVIDTSKLEELLKEGILFLKDLIAKGKRATNSQIDTHNKRVNRMVDELVSIAKQINSFNVSAEEKKRISEEAFADVVLLNSQFNSLGEQAKSMGLVNEATNRQKMELIKNVQGELSEISRDAQRAKDSSAKATVAPQRRTMTDEEAIRLLREDGSGIKAVADALKD